MPTNVISLVVISCANDMITLMPSLPEDELLQSPNQRTVLKRFVFFDNGCILKTRIGIDRNLLERVYKEELRPLEFMAPIPHMCSRPVGQPNSFQLGGNLVGIVAQIFGGRFG